MTTDTQAGKRADDITQYRLSHTMLRTRDLKRSLDFYTGLLGMKVLRQTEYPDGKFTNTFIGYGAEVDHTTIELTYNWDRSEPYPTGEAFGHIAIEVPDVYATCERLARNGVKIVRPAGPMKHGSRVIAFVEDPDGYKVELNDAIW